jgi:hypothetical protein
VLLRRREFEYSDVHVLILAVINKLSDSFQLKNGVSLQRQERKQQLRNVNFGWKTRRKGTTV